MLAQLNTSGVTPQQLSQFVASQQSFLSTADEAKLLEFRKLLSDWPNNSSKLAEQVWQNAAIGNWLQQQQEQQKLRNEKITGTSNGITPSEMQLQLSLAAGNVVVNGQSTLAKFTQNQDDSQLQALLSPTALSRSQSCGLPIPQGIISPQPVRAKSGFISPQPESQSKSHLTLPVDASTLSRSHTASESSSCQEQSSSSTVVEETVHVSESETTEGDANVTTSETRVANESEERMTEDGTNDHDGCSGTEDKVNEDDARSGMKKLENDQEMEVAKKEIDYGEPVVSQPLMKSVLDLGMC